MWLWPPINSRWECGTLIHPAVRSTTTINHDIRSPESDKYQKKQNPYMRWHESCGEHASKGHQLQPRARQWNWIGQASRHCCLLWHLCAQTEKKFIWRNAKSVPAAARADTEDHWSKMDINPNANRSQIIDAVHSMGTAIGSFWFVHSRESILHSISMASCELWAEWVCGL